MLPYPQRRPLHVRDGFGCMIETLESCWTVDLAFNFIDRDVLSMSSNETGWITHNNSDATAAEVYFFNYHEKIVLLVAHTLAIVAAWGTGARARLIQAVGDAFWPYSPPILCAVLGAVRGGPGARPGLRDIGRGDLVKPAQPSSSQPHRDLDSCPSARPDWATCLLSNWL